MARFQSTIDGAGSELKLVFNGVIDEDAQLPALPAFEARTLEIDLRGVTAINSVGIRIWLKWVRGLTATGTKFVFDRAPSAIVLQFNMVDGFLPRGSRVRSFYLPASCDVCGEMVKVLIQTDQIIQDGRVHAIKIDWLRKKACKTYGESPKSCSLDADFNMSKYMAFLSRL